MEAKQGKGRGIAVYEVDLNRLRGGPKESLRIV